MGKEVLERDHLDQSGEESLPHAQVRGASRGEALRIDRARATAHNGDERKLAAYLGELEEGDNPEEHEGEPLLYVSRKVSAAFDGCVVDPMETPEGVGFAIASPEAGRDARS